MNKEDTDKVLIGIKKDRKNKKYNNFFIPMTDSVEAKRYNGNIINEAGKQ